MELQHECKSSQWYVENASVDMFANIGAYETQAERASTLRGERVIEPEEDHKYVVRVPKLSLSDRLAILLGDQVPVEVVDRYNVLALEDFDHSFTEEELRLRREWVMEHSDISDKFTGHIPTPREQKEEADKLVAEYPRKHNPELIEAIKSIPPNEELRLLIPGGTNLTKGQKEELARVVLNYIKAKYPQEKVEAVEPQ